MTLSQARLKLKKLFEEERELLAVFLARRRLIRGGVYQARFRCGKPNCRCQREGQLHHHWRLYWTEGGQSRLRPLRASEVGYYQRLTRNYQRFRRARARLVKIHREMMVLINFLERGLTVGAVGDYAREGQ